MMQAMDKTVLFRELLKANHHKGGIKCLRLFELEQGFFRALTAEVGELTKKHPSFHAHENKERNWIHPEKEYVVYSLLNTTGRFDDVSTDTLSLRDGKRFHYPQIYPTLAEFVDAFPHAYNMRLIGMGRQGSLPAHEEHIIARGPKGTYILGARFHLPVFTNDEAEIVLDGEFYHFDAGSIYFFNKGCVHSASNHGASTRYHVVWDMLLTERTAETMFFGIHPIPFARRIEAADQRLTPRRSEAVGEYAIMGAGRVLHRRLGLARLGIKPHVFQTYFNELLYLRNRTLGRIEFAPGPDELSAWYHQRRGA